MPQSRLSATAAQGFARIATAGCLIAALTLSAPMPLAAQSKAERLLQNENLKLEDARIALRLGGRAIDVQLILLLDERGLMGIDTRQPVTVINENRVASGDIPLIGKLFKQPLGGTSVSKLPKVGTVYASGNTLVVLADAGSNLPRKMKAAVPVPYPEAKRSFRPGQSFRKVRMSNAPQPESLAARTPAGTAHLAGDTLVLALPGVK